MLVKSLLKGSHLRERQGGVRTFFKSRKHLKNGF